MNSTCFDRASATLRRLAPAEKVAAARLLARGHAAYVVALRQRPAHGRSAVSQGRKVARAQDLDAFWSALALHYAVEDILAEHDFPTSLAADLCRYANRQAREIVDPEGLSYGAVAWAYLVPPREHLPETLPVGLAELCAAIPVSPAAHAA